MVIAETVTTVSGQPGNTLDTLHPLHALNIQLVQLEGAKDVAALTPLLHDALVFRRATGGVVGKKGYLESLDAIVSVRWARTVVLDIQAHSEDLATVNCLVAMDREQVKPDGTTTLVQGVFFNARTWTRIGGVWQLLGWFNTRAGD